MSEVHPLRREYKGIFEDKTGMAAILMCLLSLIFTGASWG